jgi:hypothetical protein
VEDSESILRAAENVLGLLQKHGIDAVVIGAVALAAYHYVRQTEDIDLGVNADINGLRALAASLASSGYSVELREPDAQDSLGGVIDVRGQFGILQIISFAGRFPIVIEDELEASTLRVRQGSPLKIVPLPHLIALKLYAGGHKSQADIVELLERNPELDLSAVRALCRKYRLQGLEELIDEADLNVNR